VTQRVIVTAAASGIGRAIAAAFVNAGSRVEVCDVDAVALDALASELPGVGTTAVDLRDGDAIDAWLDTAIARLGGVDVLVNNAGVKGPTAFVEDVVPEEWSETLSVCLESHYRCIRWVAPLLKAQRHGTIVNLSSMAGMVGYGMRTPYAAAKWAVVGLTKSVAIELGPHDVTCNCICPGSVAGERIERVIDSEATQRGVTPEAVRAEYLAGQSISRFVRAEEIADLCVFLASPAARMISGQAIAIDGHTETYHL
jgi:NAD(P)-dependent dehydrogenase (short-subunit alcohol dehydrogenase family)